MALRFQVAAQLLVIVDLTVVDDRDRPILILDGLVPGGEIDDAEPAHCQPHIPLDIKAIIIRSAMNDLPVHRLQETALDSSPGNTVKDATDSTHDQSPVQNEVDNRGLNSGVDAPVQNVWQPTSGHSPPRS